MGGEREITIKSMITITKGLSGGCRAWVPPRNPTRTRNRNLFHGSQRMGWEGRGDYDYDYDYDYEKTFGRAGLGFRS
jgi:hypothetical protein